MTPRGVGIGVPWCLLLQEDPQYRWYLTVTLQGVTIQKASTWIITATKTSHFPYTWIIFKCWLFRICIVVIISLLLVIIVHLQIIYCCCCVGGRVPFILPYHTCLRLQWFVIVCVILFKLSLCLTKRHAMKTYWGMEVQLHAFFDLGTRWRWVVSFTPRPLYSQGKRP
jgi:hypothetical protein